MKSTPAASGSRLPKKSKATRWRATALIGVHVLAAIHIGHWMSTGSTVSPIEPSEAMEFAKNSVVNAGLVFFSLTILSTLILGRWFCGWACHVVALQDLSRALLIKMGIRPRPLRSRWMALMPLAAGFYMFFWPLVYRLYIGESIEVRSVELTTEGFWDTFTNSWFMAFLTFFIAGFAAVYFLGAKGFCTYACPYGAVFGVVDRLSPGRIRVTDACVGCGHCTVTCTSNVDVSREVHDYGMVVDSGCMKCMDCVSVCPEDALYFGMGKPALLAKPRQEKRPAAKKLPFVEELVGFAAFIFAYFAYRGFSQDRDFLLSVGLAACFGFLCILVVRLFRRADVKVPGVTLKKGGKAKPVGVALGAATLAVAACAVPYGIVPEVSEWKAREAWVELETTRVAWMTRGPAPLTAEEQQSAEVLLESSRKIRERSMNRSAFNTERLVWGSYFTGDLEGFETSLTEAMTFRKASPAVLTLAGTRFLEKGMAAEARSTFEMLLAAYPGEAKAALTLAEMDANEGDLPRATARIEEALERIPKSNSEGRRALLATRALLIRAGGDPDGAIESLSAVVTEYPDDGIARDLLWKWLRDAKRYDEAVTLLREGLARDGAPEEWRAHMAQLLIAANRLDDAVIEARLINSASQKNPEMLLVAEYVLNQAGLTEEAQTAAKRAAALPQAEPR